MIYRIVGVTFVVCELSTGAEKIQAWILRLMKMKGDWGLLFDIEMSVLIIKQTCVVIFVVSFIIVKIKLLQSHTYGDLNFHFLVRVSKNWEYVDMVKQVGVLKIFIYTWFRLRYYSQWPIVFVVCKECEVD